MTNEISTDIRLCDVRWPRAGKVALAVLAVHVVLLFFPPIPPDIRGSLWSHLLAFAFLVSSGMAVAAVAADLLAIWSRQSTGRRILFTTAAAVNSALIGSLLYLLSQPLFDRFSAEEGLWEPLSTACYLVAGVMLFKTAATSEGDADRKHLQFIGALFAFMFLEEINYLEIFGGILPRIEGHYLGSVHDLVNLWAKGVLSPLALMIISGTALALILALWRFGFLQPLRLLRELRYPGFVFLAIGVLLVAIALGIEARYIYWREGVQKPEELFELTGAIFLAAFGIDIAARACTVTGQASEH